MQSTIRLFERVRNELLITTDEEEQHDILVGVMYLEQDNGDNKKIGFRKFTVGSKHIWHTLL